jgi:glycosyltransferase involved in cell wall biosynthesis
MDQIPSGVTVIPVPEVDALQKNFKTDWVTYLLHGKIKRSFYSLKWLCGCFYSRFVKHEEEYLGWNNSVHLYSDIPGEYDVAVGFLEKKTTYYVVDHVKAKRKIAFMHTDYDAIPHDEELDRKYYKKIDKLAVVSEHTGETMLKHFPFLKGKIEVIKNMVSPEIICKMAREDAPEMACKPGIIKLTTVGRLTHPKKIDGAIRVLETLRANGMEAEWFVVGEGEERVNLEKQISEAGLDGKFHLLGARSNPYPYMKNCDIYVQPSRWEGYGITVAEAKVLCKPIIVSDIPEFREQIVDGVTGLICGSEESMVDVIKKLSENEKLKNILCENLGGKKQK